MIEGEIRHIVKLQDTGIDCVMSLWDHLVDETVDFMKDVVEAHDSV